MNLPKVSVIMGIYNCEDTLPVAIDSIVNQTYQNWELIMCDDGSTDNTYSVAQKYKEKYPEKVKLIKNEKNLGLNCTLNRCLEECTGDYVARMDGDDISAPDRFAAEVDFLNEHPEYSIVSTPMIYFDENGVWGEGHAIEKPQIRDFVFHAPFHCHAPCMIRTEAYRKVGGYTEDTRLLRFEDCNLWYKLYAAGYRGYNIQRPYYMMRDDRNAMNRRTFSSRMRAVYVQWIGFRLVKMPARYYVFLLFMLIKGIVLGFLPSSVYTFLHKMKIKHSIPF